MSRADLLSAWSIVSCVSGIALSNINWGPADGFHGRGFPVPIVMFDRHDITGDLVPFSSPLGYILNPLAVFLTGMVAYAILQAGKLLRKVARKRRQERVWEIRENGSDGEYG